MKISDMARILLFVFCVLLFSQGLFAQNTPTDIKDFQMEISKGSGTLLYLKVVNTGPEAFVFPPLLTTHNFVTITHPNGQQLALKFTICADPNSITRDIVAVGETRTLEIDPKLTWFGSRPRKAEDFEDFQVTWTLYGKKTSPIAVRF